MRYLEYYMQRLLLLKLKLKHKRQYISFIAQNDIEREIIYLENMYTDYWNFETEKYLN